MEITQLRCFLTVAREKSFTKAARLCNVTQPSLSYQISKLEEELGDRLFLRKPRSVELSPAGELLLDGASRIVGEEERVQGLFRKREQLMEGEIRFGTIPTMAPYLLPKILRGFRNDYPGIHFVARESQTSRLLREVVDEEIEFAIVSDVDEAVLKQYSLHLAPLFAEELLMAVPLSHPLANLQRVAADAISEAEMILLSEGNCLRDQTLQICQSRNNQNPLVCEQLQTALSMVAEGLGVAIVPSMAVREELRLQLRFVRFKDPVPKRMIGLLKKRGKRLSSAAAQFVDRIKESATV